MDNSRDSKMMTFHIPTDREILATVDTIALRPASEVRGRKVCLNYEADHTQRPDEPPVIAKT